MLSRREVLAGGLVGGLTGDVVDGREVALQDRESQREVVKAIDGVTASLDRAFNTLPLDHGPVGTLRRGFETFMRATTKFPDYCDIGLKVFYDIYDWHIRNRQQIVISRQPDNRYAIQFMFTTLILRNEQDPNFIGIPYDRA